MIASSSREKSRETVTVRSKVEAEVMAEDMSIFMLALGVNW